MIELSQCRNPVASINVLIPLQSYTEIFQLCTQHTRQNSKKKLRLLIHLVRVPDRFNCPRNQESRSNQQYTTFHAISCQNYCRSLSRDTKMLEILFIIFYSITYSTSVETRPRANRPEMHKKSDTSFSTYCNEGKTLLM